MTEDSKTNGTGEAAQGVVGKTLPKPKIPVPKPVGVKGENGGVSSGNGAATPAIPAPRVPAPKPQGQQGGDGGGKGKKKKAAGAGKAVPDAGVNGGAAGAKVIPAPKGAKSAAASADASSDVKPLPVPKTGSKAAGNIPTPKVAQVSKQMESVSISEPGPTKKQVGAYVPPAQRAKAAEEQATKEKKKKSKQKENLINPKDDPDYRRDIPLGGGGDSLLPQPRGVNGAQHDSAHSSNQPSRSNTPPVNSKATAVTIGEKPKKAQAPAAPGAKTTKEIKKCLDANNIAAAMDLFHTRSESGLVDAEASRSLLQYCIKTPGALLDAFAVVSYAKQKKYKITLRQFTQILMAFPQRANPIDAMDILNAMEPMINYDSKAIAKYHFHFARLIIQEFLEEALQTLDRIANAPAFGLQENGLAAMDVIIEPLRKNGQLALNIPPLGGELQRALLKGDTLLLSRTGATDRSLTLGELPTGSRGFDDDATGGRSRTGGYHAETEFEAEVVTTGNRITVRLIGVGAESAATVTGAGWRVDKLANRTSFHRQLKSMEDMMEVKQQSGSKASVDINIRDTLIAGWDGNKELQKAIPEMCEANLAEHMHIATRQKMIDKAKDIPAMQHMNQSQLDALMAALFNRVTLIQGPPGTGKTHTAVALVQMWLKCGTYPILCTSDSNIAVDNLVDGLARAGVRVARIGRPEAVRQDLMPYMIESIAGIDQDCRWSKEQQFQAINNALRRAEVICATCAGAGSDILERFSFQACLIDEATQATEPATVIPLTKGCKQVVLIGDQNQLPPTIISREAEAAGLGESLFERFIRSGIRTYMLKVQYRMHPAIALFPSKTFYNGELLSGTPPSQRRAPIGFDWPVPAVPLAFVNVEDGAERSDGSSQTNPNEVQRVVNIVKKLAGQHEVLPGDIGVVTPYSAQARAIKKILRGNAPERTRFDAPADPRSMKAVEVSTVDGFQGREKEVIVFSCVRANMNGNVGFLADTRRVNVMLTRAKRGLIIVGHMKTLQQDEIVWKEWLRWAKESGLVCGLSATDSDAANRLASIGMSSALEIGGTGIGQTIQKTALGAPVSWATSEIKQSPSQPKLAEREFIPDAWDDSDDEGGEDSADINTVPSVSSLTGVADEAWDSE
jgi:DNA polymerase III delta prime subunit